MTTRARRGISVGAIASILLAILGWVWVTHCDADNAQTEDITNLKSQTAMIGAKLDMIASGVDEIRKDIRGFHLAYEQQKTKESQ